MTLNRLHKVLCDVITHDLSFTSEQQGGIDESGKSIVVEIDESSFGKVKYHRGHPVEGVWVFGMVERTEARRVCVSIVKRRDATPDYL